MRLQKIAKTISWLSFMPMLWGFDVNFHEHVKINLVSGTIYAIIAIQICLLILKKYVASFRFAIIEISVYAFVFLVYLYPDPHNSTQHVSFNIAIYLWFLGGSVLAIAGWICHKAILEIKSGVKQESTNQPM